MTAISRRSLLALPMALAVEGTLGVGARAAAPLEITIYRNPGCGCCHAWMAGLQAKGFSANMIDDANLDKRRTDAGVPADLAGCHTAFLGDYVIEGHVPAEDILSFIAEKSTARGLAVAGMPMGSPGMETGGPVDPYDVMAFFDNGTQQVYARH